MTSPKWSPGAQAPIAAAIAAAAHEAWQGPEAGRSNRFADALRKMVGADVFERIESAAFTTFQLQASAPEGFDIPPEWAWFTICPGCQELRRTKFTKPQNGRVKLQVLRDPNWLSEQFEQNRTCGAIAQRLGCSSSLVVDWAGKHGLMPPKTRHAHEFDAEVARRHNAGEAPGAISRALETPVMHVRQSLKRQGIAHNKRGHHYFDSEWWRVRIVDQQMTLRAATREAGIRPHEGAYWMKKFGLDHITKARGARKSGRPKKYPQLYDREQLRKLIEAHGTYEAIAASLGCSASAVSLQCRKLLGHPRRWQPVPHGKREWWVERLDAGSTTYELAEEAGIAEKSAREKLRLLGLLDRGYANNYAREKAARRKRSAS